MSEWIGINGEWRSKIGEWIGISGEWRRVIREWIGINGEWKLMYAALSVSVTPSSVSGNRNGFAPSGSVTSGVATATPSYGSGNYSYAWTHVSTSSGNTPYPVAPTSAATAFRADVVEDSTPSTSVWRVTVTDTSYGLTETATVNVNIVWTNIS